MKEEYSDRILNLIRNVVCYHHSLDGDLRCLPVPHVGFAFGYNHQIVNQYLKFKELLTENNKEIKICNSLSYAINNKNEDNLFFETEKRNVFILISKELVQKIIIAAELQNLW
jgi:hypothetical protein